MTDPYPPIRADLPTCVAALYQFAPLDDLDAVRAALLRTCRANGVRGTLLLAREGINGTIAGSDGGVEAVLGAIRALPGCAALDIKRSRAAAPPFLRLKVRIKREIVTMGVADIDPVGSVGHYVAPGDWNALVDRADTVVIDTRNEYEVAIGTFAGAVDPGTRSFRDFPAWFRAHRDELKDKRVAMFCTGGIRCEKATAFLKAEGVEEVFHLKGGILAYLEAVPAEESRWQGECFVFDQRVAVGHGLAQGSHQLCHGCRMPVGVADRASPLYVPGVSCPRCHATRSDEQRRGYAERHRQTRIADARGQAHLGAAAPRPSGTSGPARETSGDPLVERPGHVPAREDAIDGR